jgi:hypothetical protein
MNSPAGTTKLIIALALAGSLGLAVQVFAGTREKDDPPCKDTSKGQINLCICETGHVPKVDKFMAASAKADTYDYYVFAKKDDPDPKRYTKDRAGKVWLSHRRIYHHDRMKSTGPQVTQRLYFKSVADLSAVVDTMD